VSQAASRKPCSLDFQISRSKKFIITIARKGDFRKRDILFRKLADEASHEGVGKDLFQREILGGHGSTDKAVLEMLEVNGENGGDVDLTRRTW
jgi:hypothetical protein